MTRYIDANALIERLKFKRDVTDIGRKKHSGLECAIAQVQKQPTADVVPKSEVEKQKLEIWRLQGEVERLKAELAKAKEKADGLFVNLKAVLEERAEEWKEGERYEANDET